MIRFGSERIKDLLSRMKVADEDAVIQSRLISRQVESAQKRLKVTTTTRGRTSYNTMT